MNDTTTQAQSTKRQAQSTSNKRKAQITANIVDTPTSRQTRHTRHNNNNNNNNLHTRGRQTHRWVIALRVSDHIEGRGWIGSRVDEGMTDAVCVAKHRYPRGPLDGLHQLVAPARYHEVDQVIQTQQLRDVAAALNELTRFVR